MLYCGAVCLFFYPVCNFREFINFCLGTVRSERVSLFQCPDSAQSMFSRGTDDYVDYEDYLKETGAKVAENYTEKSLIKLHKKVIVITHASKRTQW